MDSLAKVTDTAARWIARRNGESWSEADQVELEQWLGASVGNRVEFLRYEALWREANRLRVLGDGLKPGAIPSLAEWRNAPFFRHIANSEATLSADEPQQADPAPDLLKAAGRVVDGGQRLKPKLKYFLAASVIAVLFSAIAAWYLSPIGNRYSTPIGVTAAVPLSDGSKIILNTASEIHVAVTPTERLVNLAQGEAFFDVARDPARPFVVAAGGKRVVVIGTQFSVRRDGDDLRVVVTEGKVRFDGAKAGSVLQARGEGENSDVLRNARGGVTERNEQRDVAEDVLLTAGNVADIHNSQVKIQKTSLLRTEDLLSWRNGYVVFHETPLPDAVAEFNRYNERKFVIEGGSLAGVLVSGNFRSTNVESFARLLEQGFPVTVQRLEDRMVLAKRP